MGFEQLYRSHGPALVRKAQRMLRSEDAARDVVHQLFTDLMKKKRMNVDLPYLYRATNNRCLNILRNTKRRQQLLDNAQPLEVDPRNDDATAACDVKIVVAMVEELDKRSQQIFVYRFIDEMTLEEIGATVGISKRAVSKRLAKVRDKLEQRMGGSHV